MGPWFSSTDTIAIIELRLCQPATACDSVFIDWIGPLHVQLEGGKGFRDWLYYNKSRVYAS